MVTIALLGWAALTCRVRWPERSSFADGDVYPAAVPMPPLASFLNRLPLQLAVTIPFALQVVVAVGAVGYLSYRNGQAAVHDLASQVRRELTTRIHSELGEMMAQPHIINQLNANALAQAEIDLLTGQGEQRFWQQMQLFPPTNFVYCATEADGAFLGVGRSDGGTGDLLQIQAANPQTDRFFHYYSITPLGQRDQRVERGDRPYDPRLRPWYQAAKEYGQPTWSEVYPDFETRLPTITAAVPVLAADAPSLLGICATDVILSEELNEFLRNLTISPNGVAFILDDAGALLASSTKESILAGTGDDTVLLTATDSENPVIRATMGYLEQHYQQLDRVQAATLDFQIDRDRYFLQTSRFQDGLGLNWLVVVVMPENDFMDDINDNNAITLALYGLAILLTVLSGLAISRWLTKPLRELRDSAQDIAQGHWDQPIDTSRADAIGDLSRAFAAMAEQIKDSVNTLEQRVEQRNIELIQLNQELERLTRIDSLTQTANRRYFEDFLTQEWQRLARDHHPLSLILCDADYFKPYNDTYGHPAGDRCLQELAAIFMAEAQRPADLVARYGGEEFIIILPNTDTAGAIHIAQGIHQAIQTHALPHRASPYGQVTVSMGIATAIPSPHLTPHPLISAADQALYAAKARGRNQYSLAADYIYPPELAYRSR